MHHLHLFLPLPLRQTCLYSPPMTCFPRLQSSSSLSPSSPQLPSPKSLQTLYLPPIHLPFRLKCHPDFHSVLDHLNSWILSIEQPNTESHKQHLLQARYPLLACYCFPDAHPDRILDEAKLTYWVLRTDDRLDDTNDLGLDATSAKDLVDQHQRLLQRDDFSRDDFRQQQEKCVLLLKGPWENMQFTSIQHERIKMGIDFFLQGSQRQALLRQQKQALNINGYTELRRLTSAGIIMFVLIEYGLGVEIDEETWNRPEMRRLHEVCIDHICFCNDIYSFRKEFHNGDVYNLPTIISVERQCSFQQAFLEACQVVNAIGEQYSEAVKRIQESPSLINKPGIREYMDGCGFYLSGLMYWNWVSSRYHGLDWSPPSLPPHGILDLHPQRTILTPLP